jgi:DnaJ-class molecular chaperone
MPDPRKPADEVSPGTEQSAENLCPRCSGSGTIDEEPCPDCDGTGKITTLVGDA